MKRALLITRNLPPLVGGMERLVWHIVDELNKDFEVHVIGPAGCGSLLPQGATATEIPLKPTWWYLLRTVLATLGRLLKVRPHVVFAGSGLTAPFAWLAARISGARCIVYLHGLDIEARHPLYRLVWPRFFRHCDRVLVNSRFTHKLAVAAGINPGRIAILHPGVNTVESTDMANRRESFREHLGSGDAPIMLYVGRITARKGLAPFVTEILPKVLIKRPDARLLVVGDEPKGALLQYEGQLARIGSLLEQTEMNKHVNFLGEVEESVLEDAYFAADVLIFPVQEIAGDHEGFGMVAVEAAAHGLPTVAFACGGVTDAIRDGLSGYLITSGDNKGFSDAILGIFHATRSERLSMSKSCAEFAGEFAWPVFGERLRGLVGDI